MLKEIPLFDVNDTFVSSEDLEFNLSSLSIKQLIAIHYWLASEVGPEDYCVVMIENEIEKRAPEAERFSYQKILDAIIAAGHSLKDENIEEQINQVSAEFGVHKEVAAIMVSEKLGIRLDGIVEINLKS